VAEFAGLAVSLLAAPCPWCGYPYGDHELERLAECVERLAAELEETEPDEFGDELALALGPFRPVETVEGPTYERAFT